MFGKLINGVLYLAPKVLMVNGKKVIYPSKELLTSLGYKEVIYTEVPDMREGYHVIDGWAEQDGKLIQKWNYKFDEVIQQDSEFNLVEQLQIIQDKLNQLTFDLKQISENTFEVIKKDNSNLENGTYLNPIKYSSGMEVKIGTFYTDGEDIWEAIKTGIPDDFSDFNYFDIIFY